MVDVSLTSCEGLFRVPVVPPRALLTVLRHVQELSDRRLNILVCAAVAEILHIFLLVNFVRVSLILQRS